MSFAKLALLPFFAALVTARVQRVSRVLCSVSTHDDNVSFFTSEDWRRESCRSLEMASRTSRQYLAWTCYKNKSKISWILFTGIISYKKQGCLREKIDRNTASGNQTLTTITMTKKVILSLSFKICWNGQMLKTFTKTATWSLQWPSPFNWIFPLMLCLTFLPP